MARSRIILKRVLLLSGVALIAFGLVQYFRPLPTIQPVTTFKTPASEPTQVSLPWPNYGQAAVGAVGFDVLQTSGIQKAAPTASVAKIITALSVMQRRPMNSGEQGPTITINALDVTTYNDYFSKGGSVAKVTDGEQISQYQAMQAMLLPSANNYADTLATWAFGSLDKYIEFANDYVQSLGMKDTHVADASGFSPQTMSSAHDLVLLGEAAIKNPVLADIVSQPQASVPVAGIVKNTNWLLGTDNVVGIKTGNTGEAGGCYLFASKRKIENKDITVVGAIMGAPQLNNAVSDSRPLIATVDKGFKTTTAVTDGQNIGYYQLPWDGKLPVVAKDDLSLLVWQGQKVETTIKLNPTNAPLPKEATVGSISASVDKKTVSSKAVLAQKIPAPSWRWRVFNR